MNLAKNWMKNIILISVAVIVFITSYQSIGNAIRGDSQNKQDLSIQNELVYLKMIEYSIKFSKEMSNNQFQNAKKYVHDSVKIDKKNQSFHFNSNHSEMNANDFEPFTMEDVEVVDYDEKQLAVELRILDQLYEFKFKRVENNNNFYFQLIDAAVLDSAPQQNIESLNVQMELSENVRKEIANNIKSNLNIMIADDELEARHLSWIEHFDITAYDETLVKALPAMTKLNILSIHVPFKDLSIVESLKLQDLTISANENVLSEIHFQKMEELQNLRLSNNQLDNIDNLKLPPNLKTLDLTFNHISDMSKLDLPASVEALYLTQNEVISLPKIDHLKELKSLYLSKNQISNEELAKIKDLMNVQTLNIADNPLANLNFVINFPNLVALDISNSSITTLEKLEPMKTLTSLNIKGTKIQSIQPLLDLNNINFIVLDKSKVKDWEILEPIVTENFSAEF